MPNCQELYDRVKKHPDAIVKDVGEKHPFIIHEADMVCELVDGSKAVCRQSISDSWLGNLRECLAHLV
jgi:hypothetical protein